MKLIQRNDWLCKNWIKKRCPGIIIMAISTPRQFLMRACKRKTRKNVLKKEWGASYINKGVVYYKNGKFYDRNMKKRSFLFWHTLSIFSIFLSKEKGHFSRLSWKPINYCRPGRCFFLHSKGTEDMNEMTQCV